MSGDERVDQRVGELVGQRHHVGEMREEHRAEQQCGDQVRVDPVAQHAFAYTAREQVLDERELVGLELFLEVGRTLEL